MATNSEINALSQQRLDIPHLRFFESGVRYDLDSLAYMLVGEAQYVVKGFELLGVAVGSDATKITFKVAGSKVIHPLASESGSIFSVPSNRANEILDPSTNTRMSGSCQPSSINYIGIDLKRSADPSTADIVQFLDPSQNTESSQKVPLRRTIDYVWIISQTDFTFNKSICSVAIVVTDNKNTVSSITDVRPILCRLTPGGSVSSEINPYSWPGGRPDSTLSSTNAIAGDKALRDLKTWMNAVMTRLWELGGGEQWFSPTADRNVNLNTGGSVFSSTGESFEVVAGNLHWQGLSFSYDNSQQFTTTITDQLTSVAGLTDLASGECIYVDLNRTSTSPIVAQKGSLSTLGLPNKPGSRWVIASRIGSNYYVNGQPWPIGSSFSLATTTHAGVTKISIDAVTTPNPIAVGLNTNISTGYGVATCSGVSHNLDVGSAHTLTSSGDLLIGRGSAAGDENVVIKTEGQHFGVTVQGTGDVGAPHLSTRTGGGMPYGSPTYNSTHLDLDGLTRFEGTRSWNLVTIDILPLAPLQTVVYPSAIKYFAKQTKTFKPSCRVMINNGAAFWTPDYAVGTLTRINPGVVSVDDVTLNVTDSVLVNIAGFEGNGIYTLTIQGDGVSVHAVLTRRIDAGGPNSASVLGIGYDFFDGVTVKVTAGTNYHDTYWVLNTTQITDSILLNGTMVWIFDPLSTSLPEFLNSDQMCIMWWDGSYCPIATSPTYSII